MPLYGDPNSPTNLHVAPLYISESMNRTGIPNIVTSVLASYRGYDTFGETTVILTAGVGVILLLRRERRTTGQPEPPPTDADTGGPA